MTVWTQEHDDDCLRAALASLARRSRQSDCRLRTTTRRTGSRTTTGHWSEAGWPFVLRTCAPYEAPDGRWIAVVPSLTQPAPVKHAVVMEGHRLYHDPGRRKVYKVIEPEEAKCGILVVLTGSALDLHRNPTWQPRELTGLGEVEALRERLGDRDQDVKILQKALREAQDG